MTGLKLRWLEEAGDSDSDDNDDDSDEDPIFFFWGGAELTFQEDPFLWSWFFLGVCGIFYVMMLV